MSMAKKTFLCIVPVLLPLLGVIACSGAPTGAPSGPGPDAGAAAAAGENQAEQRHPELVAGLEAIHDQRWDEARDHLLKVPQTDPNHLAALHNLGFVYDKLGQPEESLKIFRALAEAQPEEAHSFLGEGWALYSLGRYPEAELAELRALEVSPRSVPARYNVALFRVAQGKISLAIDTYTRALTYDPQRTYVPRAIADLLMLGEKHPELPETHYALAYFANLNGAREEEIRQLQSYLEAGPSGPAVEVARSNLARALEAAGAEPTH